jgi:hypothetical protein
MTEDNKPKRNDLPDRAAKRITSLLFPADHRTGDPVIESYKYRLEKEISRAIWDEMIHLEGEILLAAGK